MSLINKVLRDLEAQRDTASERNARSPLVQDNLRPVRSIKPRLSRQQLFRIGLVVATVAVGVFAWSQWGAKLFESGKTPVAPKAVAPPPEPAKVASAPTALAPPKPALPPAPSAKSGPPPKPVALAEGTKPVVPAAPAGKPAQDVVVRKSKAEPPTPEKPAAPAVEPPAKMVTTKAKEPVQDEVATKDEVETKPATKPKATPQPDDSRDGGGRAASGTAAEKPAGKTVLEKKVKPLSPQDKAESQYRLAATGLQQNRVSEAENHLRAALAAQPAHVKARELLAGLALQGGRWRETQALLEQGLNLTPGHYPYAQLLARVYVDHGSEKKALELLEKSRAAALADADDSRDGGGRAASGTAAEYFAFLATLYQRAGRHDEAVKSFTEAVKLRPQEGRWWLGAAISFEAVEQWKAAGEAYQRAAASGSLDKQLLQYAQQRLAIVKNK